jgi:hypothetical protein
VEEEKGRRRMTMERSERTRQTEEESDRFAPWPVINFMLVK